MINMCQVQFSNGSSISSSSSRSILFGTPPRLLRARRTGVCSIVGCSGGFALDGAEAAFACTESLGFFVDCELPLLSGPRVPGCSRDLSCHPPDVFFLQALEGRPSLVARGLLWVGRHWLRAERAGFRISEIDGALVFGSCCCY